MRWLVWAALVAGCAGSVKDDRALKEGAYDGPCRNDWDCARVEADCCGLHCTAVLKERAAELTQRKEESCDCVQGVAPQGDGSCYHRPVCVERKCILDVNMH